MDRMIDGNHVLPGSSPISDGSNLEVGKDVKSFNCADRQITCWVWGRHFTVPCTEDNFVLKF